MNIIVNVAAFADGVRHVAQELFEKGRSVLTCGSVWILCLGLRGHSKRIKTNCTVLTQKGGWSSTECPLRKCTSMGRVHSVRVYCKHGAISGSHGGEYEDVCLLRCCAVCCLHHQGLDDGGSMYLWNVGKLLPDYTAQHTRRHHLHAVSMSVVRKERAGSLLARVETDTQVYYIYFLCSLQSSVPYWRC
jgi:hypothetical protein